MNDQQSNRVQAALKNHDKGYNCAQAVICAFADKTGLDEKTLFRITEGLGLGMGCMDGTCGAISAASILAGLTCSSANLEAPDSKAISYQVSKRCLQTFKEKNGSIVCRELKGIDTKEVLRSCNGCIQDAADIISRQLFEEES